MIGRLFYKLFGKKISKTSCNRCGGSGDVFVKFPDVEEWDDEWMCYSCQTKHNIACFDRYFEGVEEMKKKKEAGYTIIELVTVIGLVCIALGGCYMAYLVMAALHKYIAG